METEKDEINFLKLEKELAAAVEADKKYARENAAKFRAVEQRVGTYDEFRNIVLASSLQPLERKDIEGTGKSQQPLNPVFAKNQPSSHSSLENNAIEGDFSNTQTESADTFIKRWKRTLKTSLNRFQYLTRLDVTISAKIFKSEVVGDLLGEIISTLNECFDSVYLAKMLDILKTLSLGKRFALSLQFLNKSEKKAVNELLEKLDEHADEEQKEMIKDLKQRYLG